MDDLDLGVTIKGFAPGQKVFNRYSLVRMLGRGGMGVVWLAKDEELGRETALKFLPEVLAMDRAAVQDMKREVRRAIDLAHPNIVKIHDFITDGRTAAVSMEYIAGGTLSSLRVDQAGQVFSVEQLVPWVKQLCAALDYAHQDAEVVHRDLKPTNLMIDKRGRMKVLDFGIAASISDSVSRVSKQAGSSGTPVYMSPQQMMGEDPAVTDDVYSVGATLYELLTGKPPFHSGNILLQVQSKVAPPLNERRKALELPPVPAAWEETIAACLAKEPAQRPRSAGEIAVRLGLESASFAPRTPSVPKPVATPEPPEVNPPAPPVIPGKPLALGSEISGLRRWVLAPLAGAALPMLALYLAVAQHSTNAGALDPESLLVGLIVYGLSYLPALLFVARLMGSRPKQSGMFALGCAVFGALAGFGLAMSAEAPDAWIVPCTIATSLAWALSGHWMHRLALGRPVDAPPDHFSGLPAIGAASLSVILFFGGLLPDAINEAGRERREQYEREQRAQREQRELQERQEAEKRAAAERQEQEQRLADKRAAAVTQVGAAFAMVFGREPTESEKEKWVGLVVNTPEPWQDALLRTAMRTSDEGKRGGRLLVPQEFPTITEAINNAVDGNVVQVAEGTYREPIYINKNIDLIGAGRARVIVENSHENAVIHITGTQRCTVSGFTFRHLGTSEANSRASAVSINETTVTFRGNAAQSSNGNGIHVKGAGQVTLTGNHVQAARWIGIALYGGTTTVITDNDLVGNTQQGLAVLEPVASARISGNRVTKNQMNGIWLVDGTNVMLSDNRVSQNGLGGDGFGGIGIGAGTPELSGNISRDNKGAGIWWNQEKAAPRIRADNYSDGQELPRR